MSRSVRNPNDPMEQARTSNLGYDTFQSYTTDHPTTSRYIEMMDDYLDFGNMVGLDHSQNQSNKQGVDPTGQTTHGIGVRTGLKDDYGDDSWYDVPDGSSNPAGTGGGSGTGTTGPKGVSSLNGVQSTVKSIVANGIIGTATNTAATKTATLIGNKVTAVIGGVLLSELIKGTILKPYIFIGVLSVIVLGNSVSAKQMNHDSLGRIFGLAVVDIIPTVLFGLFAWYWWFDQKINIGVAVGLTFVTGIVAHWFMGLATPLNRMLF